MIGLLVISNMVLICFYIKFQPKFLINGHLLIISYIVRDGFGNPMYRDFLVFNMKKFKFVKENF